MRNIFNSVLFPKVGSNRFDLSHDVKMSFQMGELIPTCCIEAIPGDKFEIRPENMLRFAPLVSPVMHKVRVTTDYFFVPIRILWPEWEAFIAGDGGPAPFTYVSNEEPIVQGSIADYLGMPVGGTTSTIQFSALPIAAYAKVWDEYYRDQNLQSPQSQDLINGFNSWVHTLKDAPPLRRAWQHDYFTAALPFAQKGDSVQIPLTSQDDIEVDYTQNGLPGIMRTVTGATSANGDVVQAAGPVPFTSSTHVDGTPAAYDPNGTLTVDVQSDATDINTLRRAFRLQEWLEKNARGGTRYVENILAHFGVKSSDARLQRPEYIGRSRQNMVISEVLATAQSTADGVAVGSLAGHGISVGGGNTFKYRCEEHGFILGIINVQPDTAYMQGIHRMWSRFDKLDYAWPTFANIGEQEVLQKEIKANIATIGLEPTSVFGYVPRYSEYKYLPSRVAGEMRDSLAFWHLARIFEPDTDPLLNEEFVECNPSTRIFAVTSESEDHIFAHVINNVKVIRKLPRYGVPTI